MAPFEHILVEQTDEASKYSSNSISTIKIKCFRSIQKRAVKKINALALQVAPVSPGAHEQVYELIPLVQAKFEPPHGSLIQVSLTKKQYFHFHLMDEMESNQVRCSSSF